MLRAGLGGDAQHGVAIVWCEGAGLGTAVEGKNAEGELGLCVFVEGEVFGAEVFGVEPPPDGVVVEARGTHADVVAHDISVGAWVPAEENAVEEGVDGAEAQGAGGRRDIVLVVESGSVGPEGGIAQQGGDAVADGVGTDDTMEGVGEVCVGKGGYGRESGLVGVTPEELIGRGAVDAVPTELPHMMACHHRLGEMQCGRCLGGKAARPQREGTEHQHRKCRQAAEQGDMFIGR